MTYHILLDNSKTVDVKGSSAGDAMQIALERNPGHMISQCWSGYKHALGRHFGQQAAYVDYEVPPHKAVSPTTEQQGVL